MSGIFDNEQAPAYVTLALQRLTETFGEIKRQRFESYERVLTRKRITERVLHNAVRLAEERWDRWQAPAGLLRLCDECMPRHAAHEEFDREEWTNREMEAWHGALQYARAKNDEPLQRTAGAEIDNAVARRERTYTEDELVGPDGVNRGFPNSVSRAAYAEMDRKCREKWPDDPHHPQAIPTAVFADAMGTDPDGHYS